MKERRVKKPDLSGFTESSACRGNDVARPVEAGREEMIRTLPHHGKEPNT